MLQSTESPENIGVEPWGSAFASPDIASMLVVAANIHSRNGARQEVPRPGSFSRNYKVLLQGFGPLFVISRLQQVVLSSDSIVP